MSDSAGVVSPPRARVGRIRLVQAMVALGIVTLATVGVTLITRSGALFHRGTPASHPLAVVYLIDTLRRDRLGVYGYDKPTSPRIDALARECTVFDRAHAPAPWTLPSVASLLTSRDPLDHGLFTRGQRLDAGMRPLAEWLHDHGWRTGAFVTNPFGGRASGLDRGYDHFDDIGGQAIRPAKVAAWLDGVGTEPAFAYLHSTEPHSPYRSPQRFRDQVGDFPARRREQLERQVRTLHHLTNWDVRRRQPRGETRNERLQARLREELAEGTRELSTFYDAEVAWADHNVGRIVDLLRERGAWSQALFVLTSDHGDEIFEHGDLTHGQSLYAELVRVPMIVCFPEGQGAGRRLDAVVTLLDVMPTVLAYAGLPAGMGLSGRDLTPLLEGGGTDTPRVTSVRINRHKYSPDTEAARGSINVAVDDGRWRGIWNVQPNTVELYDTTADPGERYDRAREDPARAAALGELARRWAGERWPADLQLEASRTETMDAATVSRLRALGYLP